MIKLFFSLLFLFFSWGCASYQTRVEPARELLKAGNCDGSLKILEELSAKVDADQLVYLMDYGSALQACKQYEKSNKVLLQAESLADQLDYHSVSKLTAATLLSEEMVQYKGDTFEKLFLNVSLALNYIQLGAFDEAMVEIRKINEKFIKFSGEDKKTFELNSFSQYLSGLIYESSHKYDDACIAYRTAFFLDQNYRNIGNDMLKACWQAHRTDEFNTLVKKMNATNEEITAAKKPVKAQLIVILMQGWGPRKYPRREAPTFPQLISVKNETQYLRVDLLDDSATNSLSNYISEPVYSFEQAAIKTLDADYASLVARRLGSRVAKSVVADQIRQKNQALGTVALLAMVASDRADLRQWSIYPKTMQIIKIPLKSGLKHLKFTGLNFNRTESELFSNIDIALKDNQNKIIMIRSLK